MNAALAGPVTSVYRQPIPEVLGYCTSTNNPPDEQAFHCAGLAQDAYVVYLDTGNAKWYAAALAVFNYMWNFDFGLGKYAYDRAAARAQATSDITVAVRYDFPEYGNNVP